MSFLSTNSPVFAPQAFCWRPDSIRPYESLWSVFQKLAQLNATTASGVIELLYAGGAINSRLKANRKLDLLRFGLLDREQLAEFLHLEPGQVYQASALAYLREDEITSLASTHLRYCPCCLRTGFHSPVHQFLFLKRCPAHHKEVLTDHCAVCNWGPVPYDVSSIGDTTFLGGECCLKAYRREGKRLTKKPQTKFGTIVKLLVRRCQMGRIDQPIERWLGPETGATARGPKLLNLVRYWQDLCSSPTPEAKNTRHSLGAASTRRGHIAIRSESIDTTHEVEYSDNDDAKRSLFLVYKSIYRHVLATCLRSHRPCVNYLIRRMSSDCNLGMNRGKICASAQAFIMWRMFFENAYTPNQLTNGFRGRRSRAIVYWRGTSFALPSQALYRIFALECLAIFSECLLLAEHDYRTKTFSFNTSRVTEGRLPYWSIENKDDGSMIIHWWPRSVSRQAFSFTSMRKAGDMNPCSFKPKNWS